MKTNPKPSKSDPRTEILLPELVDGVAVVVVRVDVGAFDSEVGLSGGLGMSVSMGVGVEMPPGLVIFDTEVVRFCSLV